MHIICHYAEIGLKKGKRRFFEEKLVENIKSTLKAESFKQVKRISGRIIIEFESDISPSQWDKISVLLKNVFGISHFSLAQSFQPEIEEIKKKGLEILKEKEFKTFKIETQRSNKNFPLTSPEINRQIGEHVLNNLKKKVDLENPDLTLFIEIVDNYSFIYSEKIKGQGGLPVGSSGKALCLLSGGIDSPLAAYLAMKRGIKLELIHLYFDKSSIKKVKEIAKILSKFQKKIKLHLIPFKEIQEEIARKLPLETRCLHCKRMMLKIAREIGEKEGIKTIITGENIGQVASQTLANLRTIELGNDFLILRPLSCFDKKTTIEKTKEIGSYEKSIIKELPCPIVPEHPETKSSPEKIRREEEKIDREKLVKKALAESEDLVIIS